MSFISKHSNARSRSWFCVLYVEENELIQLIKINRQAISRFSYIYHDKDVYDKDIRDDSTGEILHKVGDLKKLHCHLLVDFFNGHTFSAVRRMFTTDADKPVVQAVTDKCAVFRYLTHKDDKDKYQYSDDLVVTSDDDYYKKLVQQGTRKDSDDIAVQIVNDLVKGVSIGLMVQRYGRDFVIHMRQYKECADLVKEERLTNVVYDDFRKKGFITDEELQEELPFD
jgi:hypothetical protein